MRILLTNDDGVHSPGLVSLEKIARAFTDDIVIVAPETDQSGSAHSLTLNDPLRLRLVRDRHYAVKGTPTDCVIMALRHLLDHPPDIILSGVNRGHNIADDVTYSGTIAGAIEGTLLGVKSFALSQAYGFSTDRRTIRWEVAETQGPVVLEKLLDAAIPKATLININFPDCQPEEVAGTRIVRQGKRNQDALKIHERIDGRGNPYYWLGFGKRAFEEGSDTDLWALQNNYVSVTPLSLDLTNEAVRESLMTHFS